MTTMTDERRTLGIELRDVETTQSLSMLRGRAVPYDTQTDIGWFLEEFAKGSLGKSARESAAALPLLVFHEDRLLPIGAAARWDEQATGLYGEWRIDDDTDSQKAAKKAADGFLNFMSIRFQPIRSTWTQVEDYNPDLGAAYKDSVVRVEARLLETSLVSTPAYNAATVEWVRSGEPMRQRVKQRRAVDAWREELERLRGSA